MCLDARNCAALRVPGRTVSDPYVIAPSGELDIAAARDLAPQLNEAAGQLDAPVVVDLSDVSFVDSTALGAIVQADGRMQRTGRRLSVVAPSGSAAAVLLELSNMEDRLVLHRSREEALEGEG
ncbi:STAS domain-containing protein [Conexibacter sp. SYSU D00693]|uniref:STAS domain-containing protein n=1 Tax=Conexibacter sp. SYSU D00693 TaxID=2812560 RepID=UPI0035304705